MSLSWVTLIYTSTKTIMKCKHLPQLHDGDGITMQYSFPTHKEGNCLDLIFTESMREIVVTASRPIAYISDHQIVAGNISIPKDDVTRKENMWRKLKSINYIDLAEEMHLDSLLLENLEYNDLVRKFKGYMKEALNIIAPKSLRP